MTNERPTCFISYCREGVDRDSLDHLVLALRQASAQRVDFLIDEDLTTGAPLVPFMERLRTVDGVVIILTPEYKLRVEDRKGGVYKEFSEIIRRYQELETEANRKASETTSGLDSRKYPTVRSPFCLKPLIFSGTYERSCPRDISQNVCTAFTSYRAFRDERGKLHVTSQTENQYKRLIKKIAGEIVAHHAEDTDEVRRSFDDFHAAFLQNTKHEHGRGNPVFDSAIEKVFVKTFVYRKVKSQTAYLLVGRKGSGKSTIVDYLAREADQKYGDAIEINVNKFRLEYLYSVASSRQALSEMTSVVQPTVFFEVVWELFIYICCIDVVIAESVSKRSLRNSWPEIGQLEELWTEITGVPVGSTRLDYVAGFVWCYTKIHDGVRDAIQDARTGDSAKFAYDIATHTEPDYLLREAITAGAFHALEAAVQKRSSKFLVSFDGFDTALEEFRVRTQRDISDLEEQQRRTNYELNWLKGFTHIAIEMKSSARRSFLSHWIDFCATIPKDRFMEIRDDERDAYVYIGKFHEIRWSAIELAILLAKRLEAHFPGSHRGGGAPQDRLKNILQARFPYIPLETTTYVSDSPYVLPLFIDVLRHTFWRPREILIYFAKIIAVLKDIKKKNIELTYFAVSKCISDTTRSIIKTEFFSEFQRHCTNLKVIIEKFRGSKQILSREQIEKILGGVPFQFVDREEMKLPTNLKFLYEIGFLGLEADESFALRMKLLNRDVFWFNAGDDPFDVAAGENFANCRFVIHPIFCEYLDLDVSSQRMTLWFDWEYLHQQEAQVISCE